ncbi:hypothetical protein D3C80_541460 [compost metagenome]
MLDTVVLEDVANGGDAQFFNVVHDVGMHQAHAAPAGFRRRLRTRLQRERTDLARGAGVGVASESPIGGKQFNTFIWHDDHL